MSPDSILRILTQSGIISGSHAAAIDTHERKNPFTIHRELRTILFLGIALFTAGIGILVYENIDTIGHQVIIAAILAASASCFYYTIKHAMPYTHERATHTGKFYDPVLLLGCATFLTAEGYLQYQYEVFGTRYGLAVIIPTTLFFFLAYRYDHAGVLSMAITGLASWLGLTIAPLSVLSKNDFADKSLVVSAIVLGTCLVLFGYLSERKRIKAHFAFTYFFLGGNLATLACLVGLFAKDVKLAYFIGGSAMCAFLIFRARYQHSLIFLLMGTIYGYCFVTYGLFSLLGETAAAALAIYYFMLSSIGVVFFFLNFKKLLGIKK